jgi:DNA-binding NtrC family response regulator
MKILVVDDDELQAKNLLRMLRRNFGDDVELISANDYQTAEEIIRTSSPPIDVGIFDLVMQKSHTLPQTKQEPESFEGIKLAMMVKGSSCCVIVTASQTREDMREDMLESAKKIGAKLLLKNDHDYNESLISTVTKIINARK